MDKMMDLILTKPNEATLRGLAPGHSLTINGKLAKVGDVVREGDSVTLTTPGRIDNFSIKISVE